MPDIVLDFETACLLDLRKVGAWKYSEHWSFEVLCLVFGNDAWVPKELNSTVQLTTLRACVDDPANMFVSHGDFERAVWQNYMVPRMGLPLLPNERWHDTMASAAYKAVPLGLEPLLKALNLGTEKDMEGRTMTIGLSEPETMASWQRKFPGVGTKAAWERQFVKGMMDRSPATMQRVVQYCRSDVAQQTAVLGRLGTLPPNEREVWLLDQKINQRGIGVDLEYVRACKRVVDAASLQFKEEFSQLTGGLAVGQLDKVKAWLAERGLDLPDMTKETIDGLRIDPMLRGPLARVLGIRRLLGSASVKKLDTFLASTNADGRARGLLQYHGATTGRWTGRLIQPQNLAWDKEGKLQLCDPEDRVAAILSGEPRVVEHACGLDPITSVGLSLREAFIPGAGKRFAIGDFAGIEARVVLALADQRDKCALLASGHDVYLDMACRIYNAPLGSLTKEKDAGKRQIGKNAVLGCGFQMGGDKFHERYCPDQSPAFAADVVRAYRENWAPKVPELWYALEEAGVECMRTGYAKAYGCKFQLTDDRKWLTIDLPSGWQRLWYYDPQPCVGPFGKQAWSCWAVREGIWKERQMYGGLLTENVVQALARGLMVAAMMRLEAAGFEIVLTVHDEIVCEVDETADLAKFRAIMEQPTAWSEAMGVPIAVETPKKLLTRYAKA